jgi:hypothetical protein
MTSASPSSVTPAQLGDPRQVDERGREGEAQAEHRDEALPAGEDLGVLPGLAEGGDRLGEGRRRDVLEVGGDHSAAPSEDAEPPVLPV